MKKRAQLPDAHTYTIIFRGCAKSDHPKLAVSEAVRLYNNMLNDSRLQPNTIHMNAVIQACARAGDIESMLTIAGTADNGARSPSAWTYASLLTGLRADFKQLRKQQRGQEAAPQDPKQIAQAVQRSKSIWHEVIGRWHKGQILIDEELVCAMGRTLLLQAPKDRFEVLTLLEQTMNIPNLNGLEKSVGGATDAAKSLPSSGAAPGEDTSVAKDPTEVAKVEATNVSRPTSHATPGRNTLSLVLSLAESTKHVQLGLKYWNLFVTEYEVVPDANNWQRMLVLLRLGKSGANAASIISLMPTSFMKPATFRIALSTCLRDNMNANTMANADLILERMNEALAMPDPHALRTYLLVAMASHHRFRKQSDEGDISGAKYGYGQQILGALDRLEAPYYKVRDSLGFQGSATPHPNELGAKGYNDRRELIALARKMVGAYDKLLSEQMVDDKLVKKLRIRMAAINRYIFRFFDNREKYEPNLPSAIKKRQQAAKDAAAGDERAEDWDTTSAERRAGQKVQL